MTSETTIIVNTAGDQVATNGKITSNFDKRIPFEVLLQPEKYLSDYALYGNEPHRSSSLSSSAFWDGQGDELYSRMANNFLAIRTKQKYINNISDNVCKLGFEIVEEIPKSTVGPLRIYKRK